ncbi:hypothetical protein [Priestia aryabhattai]
MTASHTPPQYNGYKVYGKEGTQLSPAADQIVSYMDQLKMNLSFLSKVNKNF